MVTASTALRPPFTLGYRSRNSNNRRRHTTILMPKYKKSNLFRPCRYVDFPTDPVKSRRKDENWKKTISIKRWKSSLYIGYGSGNIGMLRQASVHIASVFFLAVSSVACPLEVPVQTPGRLR